MKSNKVYGSIALASLLATGVMWLIHRKDVNDYNELLDNAKESLNKIAQAGITAVEMSEALKDEQHRRHLRNQETMLNDRYASEIGSLSAEAERMVEERDSAARQRDYLLDGYVHSDTGVFAFPDGTELPANGKKLDNGSWLRGGGGIGFYSVQAPNPTLQELIGNMEPFGVLSFQEWNRLIRTVKIEKRRGIILTQMENKRAEINGSDIPRWKVRQYDQKLHTWRLLVTGARTDEQLLTLWDSQIGRAHV